MESLYRRVRSTVEGEYEQLMKSFRNESRFKRLPEIYSPCFYSTNLIKGKDVRSLRVYVKAKLGTHYVPVECYEIKNYKTSIEVSVYDFQSKKEIRDLDDAEVVASTVREFFDNLLKFMKAMKGHSNTTILKRINTEQQIQLKMKHLKQCQDMMSLIKNKSIFNPYTNLFVDEEHAMKLINRDMIDWASLKIFTECAVSWCNPLVFYTYDRSVIAKIHISERLSDRLCFMIASRLVAHLENNGIRDYKTIANLI